MCRRATLALGPCPAAVNRSRTMTRTRTRTIGDGSWEAPRSLLDCSVNMNRSEGRAMRDSWLESLNFKIRGRQIKFSAAAQGFKDSTERGAGGGQGEAVGLFIGPWIWLGLRRASLAPHFPGARPRGVGGVHSHRHRPEAIPAAAEEWSPCEARGVNGPGAYARLDAAGGAPAPSRPPRLGTRSGCVPHPDPISG